MVTGPSPPPLCRGMLSFCTTLNLFPPPLLLLIFSLCVSPFLPRYPSRLPTQGAREGLLLIGCFFSIQAVHSRPTHSLLGGLAVNASSVPVATWAPYDQLSPKSISGTVCSHVA
ncbi:hypothetical protein CC80DRAFT_288413 [Byssothecium circinans]|uniref:Uncharacterized protein n=1 Tax=Byssothecium circinans TaxID=147558 RepID=A0A6A5U5S8_9PLEO|nr:hypothetical protein CC80DRAFT_288413 [Byssothecium circinans]